MRTIFFKILFVSSIILLTGVSSYAQKQVVDAGYTLQKSASGTDNIVKFDFDKDGIQDLFYVMESENSTVFRASLRNGQVLLDSKSDGSIGCCSAVSIKGNVVTCATKGMRGFTYYRWRYDGTLKNFRLIGYDTESFGNAANDGSGKSSLNLLTGAYQNAFNYVDEKKDKLVAAPKAHAMVKAPIILLTNFDNDADETIDALTGKYVPEQVR